MKGEPVIVTSDHSQLFLALIAILAIAAGLLSVALVRSRLQLARQARRWEDLSDGMTLRASGDRILDLSDKARTLHGARPGASLGAVVTAFLDDDIGTAEAALARLSETGESVHLIACRRDGAPVEIVGEPRGGEILLAIRETQITAAKIGPTEQGVSRPQRSPAFNAHADATFSSLLAGGAAIAWMRDAGGDIAWCSGSVAAEAGTVQAEQAIEILAARPPAAPGAGQTTARSRIEVLPPGGVEAVPLTAIEVATIEGSRAGFATDASLAATAERTLSRFVQTMTETFAHLNVGLAIFDRNQTLALFNPAFSRMLQVDPVWLARRPSLRDVIDAMRNSRRIPETSDFHHWRRRLLDLFDNTEAVDYEEVWHLMDGSSINVLARPHPHGSLAFVFDDVSERMRLEQSYRQSLDLRRATVNRLDEGLAVFGADGLLQFVNDAFHEIWGTDAESILPGMHAREVMRLCQGLTLETDVWRRMIAFITSEETRRAWTARVTLGSSRTLSTRLAPLPGGATMVVFADITDSERIALALRERNEALEAVEEMRTAVLEQISHRLRNPLNTIFGFGQLLSDPRFGTLSEQQREYADGILAASGQLLDTIDDVTELASLQLDPLHDEGAEPPLAETLELTRQLLEKRAGEAGVGVTALLPEETLRVRCDAVRLRQIVFNMVAGAIQRSPAGTRIVLKAAEDADGLVEIAVAEHREDGVDLAVVTPEEQSLAHSVIRRMVTNEGGRFEQRAGERDGELISVCVFHRASDEAAPADPGDPAGDASA